jgi:lysophospholipase L1-like esterase
MRSRLFPGTGSAGLPPAKVAPRLRTGDRRLILFLLFALLLALPHPARAGDDGAFFLHDGDTVVFYGDSITEQQHYGRDIETYVLTRYPAWHVKFINSGWTSDRVSGGKGGSAETRIKRDVLPYRPTVVTILLGMNDGKYTRFKQSNYDAYTDGLTLLVDRLTKELPGVRLTLLSPTFYDENAPGSRHFHGYNSVLLRFRDFVKTLGGRRNIPAVDLNAPLAEATRQGRKRDPRFTLIPDGIHPNEAGQALVAASILKAWSAQAEPTEITLDPASPAPASLPLPWPLPDKAAPAFLVSPLPGTLDAFRVRASGLKSDAYDLLVDGQPVGAATRQELAAGVDLTRLPNLPQNRQAARVRELVQSRLDAWRHLWNTGPDAIAHKGDAPSDAEVAALTAIDQWLDDRRDRAREAAQPQTHTFSLRPAAPPLVATTEPAARKHPVLSLHQTHRRPTR